MSNYQAHVRRLQEQIAELIATTHCETESPGRLHAPNESQCRLFARQFQLLSLTGAMAQMTALYSAIENAMTSSPVRSDLWLVQAYVALKLHRFADAQRLLQAEPGRQDCPQGLLLQCDLDVQQGRYTAAREKINHALAADVTWEGLARLAHLTGLLGDFETADKLYLCSQDELTVKQMHAYAWVEGQRGMLDFARGRYPEALAHYDKANQAYSGYWFIEERIAEVKGAQGRFAEAIEEYHRLYAASPRPECAHALGDIYFLSGAIAIAQEWRINALQQYQQSVANREVHYYHYLVDLCCELPAQQHEALKWARADEEIRSNYQTQGNIAWALYCCGRASEAQEWISRALKSGEEPGVVCSRLFLQAACVYSATGATQLSKFYVQRLRATCDVPAKARLSTRDGVDPQPSCRRITSAAFSPIM